MSEWIKRSAFSDRRVIEASGSMPLIWLDVFLDRPATADEKAWWLAELHVHTDEGQRSREDAREAAQMIGVEVAVKLLRALAPEMLA